jgi:hypothetical protein
LPDATQHGACQPAAHLGVSGSAEIRAAYG